VQQSDLETLYRIAELLDVKVSKLLVEDGPEKEGAASLPRRPCEGAAPRGALTAELVLFVLK